MDIFLLWHVHQFPNGEQDAKLIGVYSTCEKANEARLRVVSQPGFREIREGFQVDVYQLDQDHWTEGYVSDHPQNRTRR